MWMDTLQYFANSLLRQTRSEFIHWKIVVLKFHTLTFTTMNKLFQEPWYMGYFEAGNVMDSNHGHDTCPAKGLGDASVKLSDTLFQVDVDVRQFSPEEVLVETAEGELIIEGVHEIRQSAIAYDQSITSRSFSRKFTLPENCTTTMDLDCEIGTNGILKVTIPREQEGSTWNKPHKILNNNQYKPFGSNATHPKEKGIHMPGSIPAWHGWPFAWQTTEEDEQNTTGMNTSDTDYIYQLEVQQFRPEELTVKTVNDVLAVEGVHDYKEEEEELGLVSRQFKRQYLLPPDAEHGDLICQMSKKGVLTITMRRAKLEKGRHEDLVHRIIHPEDEGEEELEQ